MSELYLALRSLSYGCSLTDFAWIAAQAVGLVSLANQKWAYLSQGHVSWKSKSVEIGFKWTGEEIWNRRHSFAELDKGSEVGDLVDRKSIQRGITKQLNFTTFD